MYISYGASWYIMRHFSCSLPFRPKKHLKGVVWCSKNVKPQLGVRPKNAPGDHGNKKKPQNTNNWEKKKKKTSSKKQTFQIGAPKMWPKLFFLCSLNGLLPPLQKNVVGSPASPRPWPWFFAAPPRSTAWNTALFSVKQRKDDPKTMKDDNKNNNNHHEIKKSEKWKPWSAEFCFFGDVPEMILVFWRVTI